jgi:hypothetical protein
MAQVTGVVKQVFNSDNPAKNEDLGCAIVLDTSKNQQEVFTFWNSNFPSMNFQNNRRVYFNTMLCSALETGHPVTITTTDATSGIIESVAIT